MKNLKVIFILALLFSLTFVIYTSASMSPEQKGITKYQNFLGQKNVAKELNPSSFYFLEYSFGSPENILDYQGSNLTDIISPTGNKLWFMLDDNNEAQGIMLTNNQKPLLMGKESTGKKLYKLYSILMKDYSKIDDILYLPFRDGSIFVVKSDNKESVWLSDRAAEILNLKPYKKYQSDVVINQMKNSISETLNQGNVYGD